MKRKINMNTNAMGRKGCDRVTVLRRMSGNKQFFKTQYLTANYRLNKCICNLKVKQNVCS